MLDQMKHSRLTPYTLAKNPPVEGQEEEDTQRHLNVVKNKLSGWHGIVHCELNYRTARYEV